jgi:DNA-binding PucR family transcriptional regulator
VDDLGPARLFVANGDLVAVRRYVQEILGPLLGEGSTLSDLVLTLQIFFDTGRSVRESATRLGVHENTVRLRLSKISDLIGLDVATDAHAQLSVQTALLVLRLEGHPGVTRQKDDPSGAPGSSAD